MSPCFGYLVILIPLISKTNTMYISLSTRLNVISQIIRTIKTFSTIKNTLLVEFVKKNV